MKSKNFTQSIIIQVLLISVTCFVLNWSFFQPHLVLAPYTFATILVIQVVSMIQFIRRSNRKLTLFMEWIKNTGLTERFPEVGPNGSHRQLHKTFNEIAGIIARSRADKESQQFYFDRALESTGTSIISFDSDGKIDIFNTAAQALLKCKSIKTTAAFEQKFPELAAFLFSLKSNE